ncbi:hypothetical protein H6G91_32025 [Nostoc muscorum FACHB-395]|nr:hypothetical protein [Desmonostoc muscorum FACHB-395]
MGLPDEKKKELINILTTVFSEDELKTICMNNTTKLKGNPYDAISGNTFNDRCSYLVNYLIKKGLIDDFLNICLKDELNDKTELKHFYKLEKLFDKYNCQQRIEIEKLFYKYNFQTLINILKTVKENKFVITSYKNYIDKEKGKSHLFDEWQVVDNLSLLLFNESQDNDFTFYNFNESSSLIMTDFVEKFLCKIIYIQSIEEDLRNWIRIIFPEIEFTKNTTTSNKNDIVNYLFFIIEPKPGDNENQRFFIKAQFAQFRKNKTRDKIIDFHIELKCNTTDCESYLENQIPDYIDEVIKEMYNCIEIVRLPIIELFLPINILSTGFDIKEVTDEWGKKTPIGKLYPLTVRSYERFFQRNRLKPLWQTQWNLLERFINKVHDTEEFMDKIKTDNTFIAKLINCPLPTTKKRVEFFQDILSDGFPLCLWTRYKITNDIEIRNYFISILNVDSDPSNTFCNVYKIIENIHKIRQKNMDKKNDFGYNLGVLFDHDKIPTQPTQFISPNMASKL